MFKARKFAEDQTAVIKRKYNQQNDIAVVEQVMKRCEDNLEKLQDDDTKDKLCRPAKGKPVLSMKKAHQVYKMNAGKSKVACNRALNTVYELGFWANGFHPGYPENFLENNLQYSGTHCSQFFAAFDRLVKTDLTDTYIKKAQKEKDATELKKLKQKAIARIDKFMIIVEGSHVSGFSDKQDELTQFANDAQEMSIDINKGKTRTRKWYSRKVGTRPTNRKVATSPVSRKVTSRPVSRKQHAVVSRSSVGDYSCFAMHPSRDGTDDIWC